MALMSKLVLASAVAKLNPPTVEDANALAKAVAELMGDETCAADGDGDMCTERRRTVFKDDDAAVNKKVLRVYEDGLKPLAKDLAGVSKEQAMDLVIAYEPVWAIGTGLVCPSDVAQSVHKTVASRRAHDQAVADAVRIQYGGSVTPESVDELMSMPDIDGCSSAARPRRREVRPHLHHAAAERRA
ncbi:triosephosphate isomerase [Aureococcus anophagefferens]|nr:triosephosphate isomerase [Aureococcus anophagefferens]